MILWDISASTNATKYYGKAISGLKYTGT